MVTPFERLSSILQRELGVDIHTLSPGSRLAEMADSLDWVNLLAALEEDFGLHISTEQGLQLRTVSDLMNLVDQVGELSCVPA